MSQVEKCLVIWKKGQEEQAIVDNSSQLVPVIKYRRKQAKTGQ